MFLLSIAVGVITVQHLESCVGAGNLSEVEFWIL